MGRRAGGHNRKKPPYPILKAKIQSEVNPFSVVTVESVGSECSSAKLGENVLNLESLSQTVLPTPRKRSTRASTNGDTISQCQICHLTYHNVFSLRRHLDYYGDPKHPCKECGTKFTDRRQLQSHVNYAHGQPKINYIAQCFICKQVFSRRDYYQAHVYHYHENWKDAIKPEENPAERSTDVKPAIIEGPGSTAQIVTTSSANDSPNSVEDEVKRNNDRLKEVKEAEPPNAQNVDDPLKRLEVECQSVDPTRKNENPICGNSENSGGLEDRGKESNGTTKLSEKQYLNDENKFLEPRVVEESYPSIEKDRQGVSPKEAEESDLQIGLLESEKNYDGSSKESENAVPAREQSGQPETMQTIRVKPGEDINEDKKSFETVREESNENPVPVSHETNCEPDEKNVNVGTIGGLNACIETDVFHHIQVTEKSPESVTTSVEETTAATSVISEEKAEENTGDKIECNVRNYEEELELRKLYSCKDCYVPLERVKIPVTPGESTPITVIPSIVCNRSFASKEMMIKHYQQHHLRYSDGRTLCVCGKVMSGSEALDFHFYRFCRRSVRSATTPDDPSAPCKPLRPRLSCTGCDRYFWLQSCLRSHVYNCKSFMRQQVQKILINKANIPTVNCEQACRVCHSAFRSEEKLAAHKQLYSGSATYGCAFCGTKFFGERQLKCHMITAHNRNSKPGHTFECTICNQRFPEKRYQRMHTMHIHRDKVFENIRKPASTNLSPAELDDLGDKATSVNKCNVCNISFSNEKRFINHTIYYLKSEIIHCLACDEKFEGQYKVHHHNKAVHYTEHMRTAFTHRCIICKEGFMYMTHLQAHIFHVHTSDDNTTIAVGKTDDGNQLASLENKSLPVDSLLPHLTDGDVGNANIAEQVCTVCDLKFQTAGLLAAHKLIFSNDGEYLCNRCSRKCQTPAVLLDHVTTNHSNTTIQCGIRCRRCNENFLTHRDWVSHVKHFHSPEEPSEFYLERNIASPENSGLTGYELIPTNGSISSGITYLRVKHSIDFPASSATLDIVVNANKTDSAVTESEKGISDNPDKREEVRLKLKPEVDLLIIRNVNEMTPRESCVDTSAIDVDPHMEKLATINDEQAVNLEAERTKTDNPEKKTATSRFWKIPEAIGRVLTDGGWNCSTCGYAFRGPSDLAKHMSLYSNSGPHLCEICDRRFEVHEFHRVHKFSHIDPKKKEYFCAPCNEGFQKYQTMRMHTAHRHSQPSQTLSSEAKNKDSVPDQEISFESLRTPRPNAQQQVRWPEPPLYRPVLPSIEKKSDVRTYSRKQMHKQAQLKRLLQPAKVVAPVDATKSKQVEKSGSPHLQTEIFEDEISLSYECPNCQERYPSVKQLNEHIAATHASGLNEKKQKEPSKSADTDVVCDICHKVFENNDLLSTHKKRLHIIKSMHVIKSSAPVLEITAPVERQKNPDNEQPAVVIGRLYKLEKIDILPTTVDHAKSDIRKKLTVENISGTHGEHQKVLPITTVQLRTPTGNAVQIPSVAGDKQLILQKLNMGQLVLPKPDPQNLQQVVQVNLPKAKQQNLPKAKQQNPPKVKQQNLSKAKQQNLPKTKELKDITGSISMDASRSVLKRIIPIDPEPITLLPSQLANTIRILKVESCSSIAIPTPTDLSCMVANAVPRTVTSTAVSMPISAVSSKASSAVVYTPARTVSSKAPQTGVRTLANLISSKATKTVVSTLGNSISSMATKAIIRMPRNSASNKATKAVVSMPANSVLNKAAITVVRTPVYSVSSNAAKAVVSAPVNSVPINASKTIISAPVNLVPINASKTIVSAPINSVSINATKTIVSKPENSVSNNATKTIVSRPINSVSINDTKTIVSRPENSVSINATKTIVSRPENSVSINATKTIVSRPENSVSINVTKAVASRPENSVSSNVTKAVASRPENSVSSKAPKPVVSPVLRSALNTTTSTNRQFTYRCQYACGDCNIIFMNRSQYVIHNKIAHSSPSSSEQSIVDTCVEATSPENSVEKLRNFVSTFPESANDTEEPEPYKMDFESVMIPVSEDDFEFFEDENLKSDEIETDTNVTELMQQQNVATEQNEAPDHRYTGPLKVRPFAKIVQNLKRKNDRKRKDDKTDDILTTKRPKGVFDPVAYEELCRQHNLEPPAPKTIITRSSSRK